MTIRWIAAIATGLVLAGCGSKTPKDVPTPETGPSAPAQSDPSTSGSGGGGVSAGSTDETARWRAVLEERIHFGYDRWDLSPEAQATLRAKSTILLGQPGIHVRIEGHADERGSDEYNLVLSVKRAAEAKKFLMTLGVDESRIEVLGFGEERPMTQGASESAWAANRRAEFQVVRGLPIASH